MRISDWSSDVCSSDLRAFERAIHPVHAVLLAGTVPLFLGTLLSDWAYWSTYEVQWINFASWLVVGALLFAGYALLWAVIDFFREIGRASCRERVCQYV